MPAVDFRGGPGRALTPEEDAIADPDEEAGGDDTLPADLWFRTRCRGRAAAAPRTIARRSVIEGQPWSGARPRR